MFDVTDPNNYKGTSITAPSGKPVSGEDDWQAINYAFSKIAPQGGSPGTYKSVYFPPGTYLISKSLILSNTTGAALIGSGSATIIKWIRPAGGTMFISNGNNHIRYLSLTWNGNNITSIGADHRATQTFETDIRYEQDIFENFTSTGIRIGYQQILAAAEILFLNDIFQGNGTGVSFLDYNDYDNRFLKTEFINNKVGIQNNAGIIDVSETNFYGDTTADIITNVESLRFRSITSQGSGQFIVMGGTDATGQFIIHDCRISNYVLQGPTSIYQLLNFSQGGTYKIDIQAACGGNNLSNTYTYLGPLLLGTITVTSTTPQDFIFTINVPDHFSVQNFLISMGLGTGSINLFKVSINRL